MTFVGNELFAVRKEPAEMSTSSNGVAQPYCLNMFWRQNLNLNFKSAHTAGQAGHQPSGYGTLQGDFL